MGTRAPEPPPPSQTPLGDTRRRLVHILKRHGPATIAELAERTSYARATLREHLQYLMAQRVVERRGTRRAREGRGRPEVVYGLAAGAEALFPAGDGTLLRELISWLNQAGRRPLLDRFFADRNAARRATAGDRLSGLTGRARLEAVAALLSEEGYMAEVTDGPDGTPGLRLCHCPLRNVVAASALPCRAEEALVRDLVGVPMRRTAWMPQGGRTCEYAVGDTASPMTLLPRNVP